MPRPVQTADWTPGNTAAHEMTPELRAKVKALADKQRSYKSDHKYNLAKFGLSEERIRQDCAFYYETFLPPVDFRGDGTPTEG